jgi:hypothetical protein
MQQQHTTSRFAALTLAALMTLAMLLGVGQLADHETTSVQMAHAATTPQAGA